MGLALVNLQHDCTEVKNLQSASVSDAHVKKKKRGKPDALSIRRRDLEQGATADPQDDVNQVSVVEAELTQAAVNSPPATRSSTAQRLIDLQKATHPFGRVENHRVLARREPW